MLFTSRPVVAIRFPQWSAIGPGILGGIVDFMRLHESWQIITENNSYGEMESVHIDQNWHGDGAILFRASESELQAFRKRNMAVVLTSTEGPDLGYPRVVPDNHEIGRLAARHLIECNLPHFAFLARGETFYREAQYAPGTRVYARLRLRGFRDELQSFSREPTVHYLRGRPLWEPHTWREIQTEVVAFLDSLPHPCGLFVADDSLGAVVLRAADTLGLKVPDQLAVIGFGDDPNYCYATFPSLTSIPHPSRDIGRLAAELLRRQMHGQTLDPGSRIVPVSHVIPRESSDTLAVSDPEVRHLIRHIRLRAPHEALRVTELAELSHLSMTTIKERFAQWLGHGPKQEIQRVRLQHLQHLLADRSLTLSQIARRMNFGSAHELSRFFFTETGQRPTDFRSKLLPPHTSHRFKAVIFDMDGTLFDTEPLYCQAYRQAYALQNGQLTKDEYFQHFIGRSNTFIESSLAANAPPSFSLPRFQSDWRSIWASLIQQNPPVPLPGVTHLLEELLRNGIPIALASSSDLADIDLCLNTSGLAPYFTVRAAGNEVPEGKPSPDVYLLACQRLHLHPSDALAIEDSSHGTAAAITAGLQVLTVSPAPLSTHPASWHTTSLAATDQPWWQNLFNPPPEKEKPAGAVGGNDLGG